MIAALPGAGIPLPQHFLTPRSLTPDTEAQGSRYVAAVHADGTRAVRDGFTPGSVTRAARSGDRIAIFGTGFGGTATETSFGRLISAPLPLAQRVIVRFDDVPAGVVSEALVAPGLYQFDVIVSAVASGDVEVTAEVDGIESGASVYLTVQR